MLRSLPRVNDETRGDCVRRARRFDKPCVVAESEVSSENKKRLLVSVLVRLLAMFTNRYPPHVTLTCASYYSMVYSSSVTDSNHSASPFWALGVIERCTNQLSGVAPCQCYTFGGTFSTSPSRITFTRFASSARDSFSLEKYLVD